MTPEPEMLDTPGAFLRTRHASHPTRTVRYRAGWNLSFEQIPSPAEVAEPEFEAFPRHPSIKKITSFRPETVLFRRGGANRQVCLCGAQMNASAQSPAFFDLTLG